MTLSFVPTKSKIVLIGTTQSELDATSLPDLPAVENNVKELAAIFCNPEIIGLPDQCIETILDAPSGTVLLTRLVSAANTTSDTLLVYYAGHGIKSGAESGLFVATRETTQEYCHVNGIEWRKIQNIIARSPAKKKILIFDCCYSGEIIAGELGGAAESVIANAIDINGTYAISSGPKNSQSFSIPGETHTAFTGRLIEALKGGVQDKVETITLDRLFKDVEQRIASFPNLPAPQQRNSGKLSQFIFAKNVAWASDPEVRLQRLEQKYQKLLDEKQAESWKVEEEYGRERLQRDNIVQAMTADIQRLQVELEVEWSKGQKLDEDVQRLQAEIEGEQARKQIFHEGLQRLQVELEREQTKNQKLAELLKAKDSEIEEIRKIRANPFSEAVEKILASPVEGGIDKLRDLLEKIKDERRKTAEAKRATAEDKKKAKEAMEKIPSAQGKTESRGAILKVIGAAVVIVILIVIFSQHN